MEISKELLSIILGEKAYDIKYVSDNIISFYTDYDQYEEINIYELAHKCKEWANKQRYVLFSKVRLSSSLASCYFDAMGKHDYEDDYHNDFRAETESEAIFKACQWILDNKTNIEG